MWQHGGGLTTDPLAVTQRGRQRWHAAVTWGRECVHLLVTPQHCRGTGHAHTGLSCVTCGRLTCAAEMLPAGASLARLSCTCSCWILVAWRASSPWACADCLARCSRSRRSCSASADFSCSNSRSLLRDGCHDL